MAKKIRVYELARELGLTNKEALDLCIDLGIGVKSHSSSIEDAQADRVRRKADQLGLRRDVAPEEPEPAKPARASRAEAAAPVATAAPPAPAAPAVAAPAVAAPAATTTAPPAPPLAPTPPAATPGEPTPVAPAAAAARPAAATAPRENPRLITSRGEPAAPPVRPSPPPPRPAPSAGGGPAVGAPPSPRPAPPRHGPSGAPGGPPSAGGPGGPRPSPPPVASPPPGSRPATSATGRPIPPPPGARPPTSASGKPIPPPPGRGPRPPLSPTGRPIPPPPGGGRPTGPPGPRTGGPNGPRPGGGFGAPRPSTGFGGRPGSGGGPRPGGGFGGRPGGGPPGRPGGPGPAFGTRGGPGGPGGRGGRPPQRRRTGRRRRTFEELEAQELTRYTPSHAPIPEGEIIIERGSTAKDVGPKLNRSAADVVRFLLQQGEMVTATMSLSDDMIELFAAEIGATVRLVHPGEEQEAELQLKYFEDEDEDPADQRPRPPVVTVMGHVDHGKTKLLDRIRHTNVVEGEAGGITQHIGAYQVEVDGRQITFIDTPGHAAFTAMRARGANVTDIVVLVVAADDGVMPQTIEAINHAKAADVPIVVAINKIDREDADPNRVKQQLSEQGLVPEDWGGDTIMVELSALQDLGIDDLLEQLIVVADVEELTANPKGRARGYVLEANLDVGQGPVATVLVDKGTLRVGDPVVAGAAWGKVRALIDDRGDRIKEAFPAQPVQVLGLSAVPQAGDVFRVAPDEKTARTIGEARAQRYRLGGLGKAPSVPGAGAKLEDIFEQIQRGETATLNLVLKADVQGSLEAVTESLRRLERDEVKLTFVHRAVGGITEYDVNLAAASNATIIGFNVRPDRRTRDLAESLDVEIRTYEIIYKLIEDIESAMVGMLAPEYEEVVTGDAEVREIFNIPNVGRVAGCYVLNGTITRGSKVRFLREGTVIWKGAIRSLRRFKEDVREVQAGFECGIGLSDFQDLKASDVIETYEEREIPRT